MFPATALEDLVVVDILVRFFALDLFELLFLMMVLAVGRLAVMFFGNIVVFEIVEVVSVIVVTVVVVVVLPEVVPELEVVVRDKDGSVTIGWRIVENVVVVSPI